MRLLVVLDCADADALADFWAQALGFRRGSFHPPYVRLTDPTERWPNLLLQQVPEPKSAKSRMHLDMQVTDVHAEVERLSALGATVVERPHDDAGFLTAILADPQGNEFCVIRPPDGGYDRRRLDAEEADSRKVERRQAGTVGSLAGQLDLSGDWDSPQTNDEVAADPDIGARYPPSVPGSLS